MYTITGAKSPAARRPPNNTICNITAAAETTADRAAVLAAASGAGPDIKCKPSTTMMYRRRSSPFRCCDPFERPPAPWFQVLIRFCVKWLSSDARILCCRNLFRGRDNNMAAFGPGKGVGVLSLRTLASSCCVAPTEGCKRSVPEVESCWCLRKACREGCRCELLRGHAQNRRKASRWFRIAAPCLVHPF